MSVSHFVLEICKDEPLDSLRHLVLCQVDLADGKPPEWVPLVPAGEIAAFDGREFSNPDPDAVVAAFEADPRDVPVDWEHASELKAPKGEPAPAAGWIVAMENRDGEIWGNVEWTPKGSDSLTTREYRYISPAFLFDKAKKVIKEIVSAALVNRPAMDMPAVAHTTATAAQENSMNPELLKLLGLTEDATAEAVLAAVAVLQAGPQAVAEELKAELETTRTKLTETETALANARKANPSLDKFVPRSDYDAAVAAQKTAEATILESATAAQQKAVDQEIEGALKAGKITPASKEFYVSTCAQEGGLAQFQEFLKTAPKFCEPSTLDVDPPEHKDAPGKMTADEKAIAASCGISEEDYLKSRGR